MVITLTPDLETALGEIARRQGVKPEELALQALREFLISSSQAFKPRDEWEHMIVQVGTDCGVSLPHTALSSEGLYE